MEKNKITNSKQFECMVSLMEKNKDVAKGYFTFGSTKSDYIEAWANVAVQLNSLGPPLREGSGWQKVWNDFKNKIRKKLVAGPNKVCVFSPLEERVVSILSSEKTGSASKSFELSSKIKAASSNSVSHFQQPTQNNNTNSCVLPSTEQEIEITPKVEITTPNESESEEETELNPISPPSNYRKSSISLTFQEERRQLLENQTKNIEEQTKYLKECAGYARKTFELKEKKFKMWHENEIEKRKISQQNMDYKLKSLEYKEKKLLFKERKAVLTQQQTHYLSGSSIPQKNVMAEENSCLK